MPRRLLRALGETGKVSVTGGKPLEVLMMHTEMQNRNVMVDRREHEDLAMVRTADPSQNIYVYWAKS
jgi:hypothetical protein